MSVGHWDEAEWHAERVGPMRGRWQDLGEAAGSVHVGAVRAQIEPGGQTSPVHRHGAEEEIFHVLAGDGLSYQDEHAYEVRAGDVIVHLASAEAHTLVAGEAGIEAIAFGPRILVEATHLPRAGVVRIQETWVEAPGGAHPWEREAAAGPLELPEPSPRPPTIAALDDVPATERRRDAGDMVVRDAGRALGSVFTGLRHLVVAPGAESYPPHCHSAEEELFVVLAGAGVVQLGDDEHPIRAGSIVSRPAGTGVAHHFAAGDEGLTLLAYGTRDTRDIAYYPRSGEVFLRGIGVRFTP
jgi:uncharacterized cupin superfamily protein